MVWNALKGAIFEEDPAAPTVTNTVKTTTVNASMVPSTPMGCYNLTVYSLPQVWYNGSKFNPTQPEPQR